jgi:hypothetical protein
MVNIALLVGYGATVLTLIGVMVLLGIMWWKERTRMSETVERLLTLYQSRTVGEYAAARKELDTTPRDRLRELQTENDLAQAAAALEKEAQHSWARPT